MANTRFSPMLAGVIERLIAAANELYARSESGLASLPRACRPGMFAARLLYAEIGHELARCRYDSINQRAVVAPLRKAKILVNAVLAAATRRDTGAAGGALHEALFLIDPLPIVSPPPKVRWPRIEDRVAWLVDLFERLERRERSYET
jgi:phytoene synthase